MKNLKSNDPLKILLHQFNSNQHSYNTYNKIQSQYLKVKRTIFPYYSLALNI